MNMNPQITIIMPSRNVAPYIRQCLDSVLAQTFTDIEILSVDAESDDGTWEMLSEYAAKDERIRLIRSSKRSYGYQVNIGIKEAKGRYIGIVETDDIIHPEMYSVLFAKAEETGADYVKGAAQNYVEITPEVSYIENLNGIEKTDMANKTIVPRDHPELLERDRFLWLGLYKTSFLRDNGITLSETHGAAYQDIGFQAQVLTRADKAVYINVPVYKYRQDNADASGNSNGAFRYLAYEHGKVLSGMAAWSPEQRKYWYRKLLSQYIHRYHVMAVSGAFWTESEADMNRCREWVVAALNEGLISEEGMDEDLCRRLSILREGVRETYGSFRMDHLRSRAVIKNWYSELRNKCNGIRCFDDNGRRFVIFGCGINGRYVRCLMEHFFPERVAAFCDNSPDMTGQEILGLKVISPNDAVRGFSNALFVIPSVRYETEMREQLLEAGIRDDAIVVYPFGRDIELLTMDVRSLL